MTFSHSIARLLLAFFSLIALTPGASVENMLGGPLRWDSATVGWSSIQKNKSVLGNPITLNGHTYQTGIGTHAASVITYSLAGSCSSFQSDVGVDDESGKAGSITFQVTGDGKKLYSSPTMRGLAAHKKISVSVVNVKSLVLSVTDAGDGINSDHADWAGAKLVCSKVLQQGVTRVANFYVDGVNGNDGWSGSLATPNGSSSDGPFRTISRAQSALRTASSSNKTVAVRAGTYTLSGDLAFTSSDNGQIWTPYTDEFPVIDGSSRAHHITINGVANLTLHGFSIQNMSSSAIFIQFGSNLSIRWNHFIAPVGWAIEATAINNTNLDDNTVTNQSGTTNSIFNIYSGSHDNTASHNLFQDSAGCGISFNNGPTDPVMYNNVQDRNLALNTGIGPGTTDFAPWYVYDPSGKGYGFVISNNKAIRLGNADPSGNVKGFYLDDNTSGALVFGNILVLPGQYGGQFHGGKNNKVYNNIFDVSNGAVPGLYQSLPGGSIMTGMSGNEYYKNIVFSQTSFPGSLWTTILNPGDAHPSVHGNLYFSGNGSSIPNTTEVDSSPVYANPQFTNAAAHDYSMPPTSPAFTTLGMTPFATDQGPRANPYTSAGASGAATINSIAASATSVITGSSTTISWNTSGSITSLTLNPGSIDVTGQTSYTLPVLEDTTFTLLASDGTNTDSADVDVSVVAPPFYAELLGPIPFTTETDGSRSYVTQSGKVAFAYTPWPRVPIDPAHFGGMVVLTEARLVLIDPGATDDRASAKLLFGVGADAYPDVTSPNTQDDSRILAGKLKYVTSNWRSFAATTMSKAALEANPPPIDLTGIDP